MTETLHEMAERMVGQYCRLTCETCPVYPLLEERGFCLIHWIARYENADEQINALLRWAGHPTVVQCKDCRYWQQEVDSATHWVCMQHSCGERIMHSRHANEINFQLYATKRTKEEAAKLETTPGVHHMVDPEGTSHIVERLNSKLGCNVLKVLHDSLKGR